MELGKIAEFGARKYSARNWEKGIPLSRLLASTYRHLYKFHMGMTDENHLPMAGWNIMALDHTKWLLSLGLVPAELDDLPNYQSISPESFKKLISGA
jgi:hypothetical protein